jgi:hypothetical protein
MQGAKRPAFMPIEKPLSMSQAWASDKSVVALSKKSVFLINFPDVYYMH